MLVSDFLQTIKILASKIFSNKGDCLIGREGTTMEIAMANGLPCVSPATMLAQAEALEAMLKKVSIISKEAVTLASNIESAKSELLTRLVKKPFLIEEIKMPDIVRIMYNKNIISDNQVPIELTNATVKFAYPVEGVRVFVKSNDFELDTVLKDSINAETDDDLKSIWELYFSNPTKHNPNITILSNDVFLNINKIVYLYFIAETLLTTKPSNMPYDNENELNSLIELFQRYMGYLIHSFVRKYKQMLNNNVLIYRGIENENRAIIVHDQVYTKAREQGITPETLFGLYVKNLCNMPENCKLEWILENKDDLNNSFIEKYNLDAADNKMTLDRELRTIYIEEIRKYLNSDNSNKLLRPNKFQGELNYLFEEEIPRILRHFQKDGMLYDTTYVSLYLLDRLYGGIHEPIEYLVNIIRFKRDNPKLSNEVAAKYALIMASFKLTDMTVSKSRIELTSKMPYVKQIIRE
jgi:hypothetical protein